MLSEFKSKAVKGIVAGAVLQVVAIALMGTDIWRDEAFKIPLSLMFGAGLGCFVWGCMKLTEGKGYSKWLGLAGALGIIGLVIVLVIPDRHRQGH